MAKILQFLVPVAAAAVLSVVLVCFLGRSREPELLAPEPVPERTETPVPVDKVENPPKISPQTPPENPPKKEAGAPQTPPNGKNEDAETVLATEEGVLASENERNGDIGQETGIVENEMNGQNEQSGVSEQAGQGETLASGLPEPEPVKKSEKSAFSGGGRWFTLERENFERSENVRAELEEAKFKRRLPNGFGALGIDEAQRAEIYRIQEEYHAVLTPLYQRADRLRAERDEQIRAVLTDAQKEAFGARKKNVKK